ncbi:MAG: PIN domain-containing protein [Nanoarchaeota archaeon]
MKVVLDANILISAILGSKSTIDILTSEKYKLYAPRIIFNEVVKYKDEIIAKANIDEKSFYETLNALTKFIELKGYIDYQENMEKAKEAIGKRDIKDSDYIACALSIGADFIWTNDKDFSSQSLVKTKKTHELIDRGL